MYSFIPNNLDTVFQIPVAWKKGKKQWNKELDDC